MTERKDTSQGKVLTVSFYHICVWRHVLVLFLCLSGLKTISLWWTIKSDFILFYWMYLQFQNR